MLNVMFDCLDYDDGVINHQSNRQDESKER